MADHPSWHGDEPRLAVTVLRVVIFAAVVLLLLVALTSAAGARAASQRGLDTWYECVDVLGNYGYSGSTDGDVIRWARYGDAVRITHVTPHTVHGIDMVTARVGYLVTATEPGGRARVYKTANGGSTWTVKKTARVDLIACVRFRSSALGWVAGRNGVIYKTANGGRTWVKQRSGTAQTIRWLSFPTDKVGYAVGTRGLILKTSNGGTTWTRQRSHTVATLNSVDFVGTAVGYACGGEAEGVFLKTTDGGRHWTVVGQSLPPMVAVDMATRTAGYAIGNTGSWPTLVGAIYKIEQGGRTWTLQSQFDPSPPDYGLGCLKVMSMTEAYAEGQAEASLYTDDGVIWHLAHIFGM